MKQAYNTHLFWKCEKSIKVFSKPQDSNTTYIFKDIFTFPAEDIQKITPPENQTFSDVFRGLKREHWKKRVNETHTLHVFTNTFQ